MSADDGRGTDTRDRIIEAARHLFWENFFDSKDAVMRTVLKTYRDLLDPVVVRPIFEAHAGPIDRIFGLLTPRRKR